MPKSQSVNDRLDRVRKPRVHLKYDVEIGDAIEQKELPFVVGVLADLSGKPNEPLPKLKDRKFVDISRDNFNDVLAAIKPRLAFQVDNTLQDDGTKMNIELNFRSMDDFSPEQVVQQVEPLRKLLETRNQLTELLSKMDGNDTLEESLQGILQNTESLRKLSSKSDGDGDAPAGDAGADSSETSTNEEA